MGRPHEGISSPGLENRYVPLYASERTVVDPNHGGDIFDKLKLNEWPVLCRSGCKVFLLNPSVSTSRGILFGR